LREIKVSEFTKYYLSRHYSERILVEAIESLEYALDNDKIRTTPDAYIIGTAKRLKEKYAA
ncbi:MAG TPA: hypothetical protein VGF75_07090, partial [Candidatus Saccharimonadales bacterium]